MKLLVIFFSGILLSCNNSTEPDLEYPAGGYDFPENITNKDFYCYPLIEKMSRRDSFWKTFYETYLFKLFKEPNISLAPAEETTVRFVISGLRVNVITLTEKSITIKSSDYSSLPCFDIDKLNEIERVHYRILRTGYPLDEPRSPDIPPAPKPPPGEEEEKEKIFDSIRKNTPILLKREYFDYLIKKAAIPNDEFKFSTRRREISKPEFRKFITMLNESGYWSLPYDLSFPSCSGSTGLRFFSLEVNTGRKYNYVESLDGCVDTAKFYKVCQELLKMAMVDDLLVYMRPE